MYNWVCPDTIFRRHTAEKNAKVENKSRGVVGFFYSYQSRFFFFLQNLCSVGFRIICPGTNRKTKKQKNVSCFYKKYVYLAFVYMPWLP